jgi:predicted nucleic acid-binding protein
MILLDTNLVSEPWKPRPDPHVVAWIDAQAVETLYLSAVTVAELRFGIAAMPAGKRRHVLHERVERHLLPVFAGRVLPFDLAASGAYAELMAKAKTAGRAITMADGTIAAIATARGFLVASRDAAPFHAAGIPTINPWAAVS